MFITEVFGTNMHITRVEHTEIHGTILFLGISMQKMFEDINGLIRVRFDDSFSLESM